MKKIWLAGGCFWGVEAYFQQLKGVVDTTVGYGQGTLENPTYQQVCQGNTGHAEVCEIVYDESVLPLGTLLEHFFRIIDPTALNRQGNDYGTQYRSGIYYREEADQVKIMVFLTAQQKKYAAKIVVEVEPKRNFYLAEEEHQDYLRRNPSGYCHINLNLASEAEKK
ncbi:peptide-methionine (S)-S-oxide reductase MsrA [Azotosporobacter soli]|uniref:peptide-methionine (S)-S-oxide reductase MsrA n=1 Tax=Azotosporobacter soli TaxID=3055040 RepID=UPI0031FEE044